MAPVSFPRQPVRTMWSATLMSLTGSSAPRTLRYANSGMMSFGKIVDVCNRIPVKAA